MKIRLTLCGVFVFLMLFAVQSQPVAADDEAWLANYYNNKDLWGDPAVTRYESGLNHNWGMNSPDDEILADNFSAEWTTVAPFSGGTYRFFATADDGMRVYVNNELIIDVWYDSSKHITSADVALPAGDHDLKVQYYDAGGTALASLRWEQVVVSTGSTGLWTAEYFNNINLSGDAVLTQSENAIDYTWLGVPATNVQADGFSVRWSANVPLEAGTYRFNVRTDDGVRLSVADQRIIDQWQLQTATTNSADITVAGGSVPVVMEYFDYDGGAEASLNWAKFSAETEAQAINNASSEVITDWRGEYFNNTELQGSPVVIRNDAAINWSWGTSSPVPNVMGDDAFSVRWTKTVAMTAGTYLFRVYADDGARVYVNDEIVIDHWDLATGDWLLGTFTVEDGNADIRVEYLERNLMAEIWAGWEPFDGTAGSSSSGEGASSVQTATLISNAYALTIRSGPGRDFERLGYITRNQELILLGRDEVTYWIKIQHPDGTIGWASGRYLSSATDFTTLPVLEN